MNFIVSMTSAQDGQFSATISVKLSRENALNEKMVFWYCLRPDSNQMGTYRPLTQFPLTHTLKCSSFGIFPGEYPIDDKYVAPADNNELAVYNYIKHSKCELVFNKKRYTLPSKEYVYIPNVNSNSSYEATISCFRQDT